MPSIKNTNFFYAFFFLLVAISCNEVKEKKTSHVFNSKPTSERANFYYENKNYDKAIECLDSLISFDSSNGDFFFKRGYSKSMMPDIIGACEDYKSAIKLDYRRKSAYLNIGVLLAGSGYCDSAVYFINECLKLDPENKKAKQMKDACLIQIRMRDAKEKALNKNNKKGEGAKPI